jgi:PAS domain S-box-containing protein
LQAILDAAPIPIWIAHDPQCRRITGNVYADQMVMQVPSGGNASASALPGEASVSYKVFQMGREMRPEELPAQVAAATGKHVSDQEVDLLFPDGRTASLLLFAAPLFDAGGRVRGSVAAGADITGLRIAEHLRDSILNSLSDSVAVIGPEGAILMTNEAWNRFARDNGAFPLAAVAPGANYLRICKRAASEGASDAQAAVDGIEAVIAGHRSSFQLEYSCHSVIERRWYIMNVSPLRGTKTGAVITHTNITDRKLAEIAIRTSESTIRSLLDSSTQSVVAVNPNGKIVLVNGNTQTMFGYTREELLGQAIEILIPDGFRAKHAVLHKGYFANPQNRPMGRGLDLEGLRKDGTSFPLEVSLSAIETTAGKLGVAFVNDITVRKQLEQAERAHAQEVQALAAGLMTAQEEERRRVSRELHDTICQQLASLAFDIGSLVADPPPPQYTQSRLKTLQARVVQASEETRHIAYALHPSVLDDLGLVTALRSLCKDFSARAANIELKFAGEVLSAPASREVASCIYRVAQESLQNIVKHSNAKHVSVAFHLQNETAMLRIVDDGAGFDIKTIRDREGLGLIGMEERARLVNGKLSIVSKPGQGTRIALEVPLDTASE